MTGYELLHRLREDARQIDAEAFRSPNAPDAAGTQSIAAAMTRYNWNVFSELMSAADSESLRELDPNALAEFTRRIDAYMDQYAPGLREPKTYIRIVSIYLAFVAHCPLHPPGMPMLVGLGVTVVGGEYYCPIKNQELRAALAVSVLRVRGRRRGLGYTTGRI